MCVRHVDSNCILQEKFVQFIEIESLTSDNLATAVINRRNIFKTNNCLVCNLFLFYFMYIINFSSSGFTS